MFKGVNDVGCGSVALFASSQKLVLYLVRDRGSKKEKERKGKQ